MKLALKVPPPVQALVCGILMWVIDRQLPGGQLESKIQLPMAILFAVAGIVLVVFSMLAFRRANTTVDPFHPEEASQLVVDGLFGYSRNPMYVSLLLVLISWAIWLGSVYNAAVLILFVTYITFFQIKPEEEAMRSLFGETYEHYCSRVRRWI
jgi:protein-S-isoprenylcysteine O-methyltransferase Ste14